MFVLVCVSTPQSCVVTDCICKNFGTRNTSCTWEMLAGCRAHLSVWILKKRVEDLVLQELVWRKRNWIMTPVITARHFQMWVEGWVSHRGTSGLSRVNIWVFFFFFLPSGFKRSNWYSLVTACRRVEHPICICNRGQKDSTGEPENRRF